MGGLFFCHSFESFLRNIEDDPRDSEEFVATLRLGE